ncbi:prolyl-tRNA synthetase [Acidothermus cellulolyticus 11B]|uniref:Proline--tRNA ligase n=1 Tax=Acidothermus cellulolyticus (strain ATCC 43068 / DSM 8971 / 11B) TaxID=351607 RepID=SYP_ACIC1|nr:proline--tRNA ligase [Acidothermus cellulolyticus]A0LV31.1 RecName: Full=Proline--tRNA ligase; AltName: Full=Prolyl-tRNA synthetase; Short=ProRS [Acidothermus cellulolyticus 11B]ABK53291.1 prolyl-tRNA synthetase [Acidothermus cellulolyticus 11B]
MIQRMSKLFVRTLREDPADAEVPSHRLLVRAGYIRRVAPGIYSWLPLGYAVLRKIEEIVRQEMLHIGGQEVHFPALIPREIYEASGRWNEYGDTLFRLKDRKGADYLLGPTHEELFTLLVKGEYSSYKDYPVILFQIQTKYRDEARPRAGILRGREFVMKDSYSFDLDDAGLAASYTAHREAYRRIFDRLGLRYRIVSAVSGAMGGSASEEFLAVTEVGEDAFVYCRNCDYAANTEAVEIGVPDRLDPTGQPPPQVLDTPDTPTIDALVDRLNSLDLGRRFTAADTLKNVVLKTKAPGADDWELLVVGVPGDRDVDLKRLAGQLDPIQVEPATAEDLARRPELVRGYIGPQILRRIGVRYLVDPLVVPGSAWVTGANEPDKHMANVVRGRDFEPDGEIGAATIRDGDPCGRCGGRLALAQGIEIGHIFQLGRKYTDAFELDALGPDGRPIRITMGSYGIGVSRAVAAIAEQCHDDAGLIWPRSVSPADVHVVIAGKGEQEKLAEEFAAALDTAGLDVLLDDRVDASAGVKFADAELIGIPSIAVVGRGAARGVVEVRDRGSGERRELALTDAVAELRTLAAGA